jgi:hypothetical protein
MQNSATFFIYNFFFEHGLSCILLGFQLLPLTLNQWEGRKFDQLADRCPSSHGCWRSGGRCRSSRQGPVHWLPHHRNTAQHVFNPKLQNTKLTHAYEDLRLGKCHIWVDCLKERKVQDPSIGSPLIKFILLKHCWKVYSRTKWLE